MRKESELQARPSFEGLREGGPSMLQERLPHLSYMCKRIVYMHAHTHIHITMYTCYTYVDLPPFAVRPQWYTHPFGGRRGQSVGTFLRHTYTCHVCMHVPLYVYLYMSLYTFVYTTFFMCF